MDKYIKLEDAIGVCREKQIIEGDAVTGVRYPTPNEIINDLSDLPTIEVCEGEWVKEFSGNGWNDYWDYTCSNCGKKYERADSVLYHSSFCPNCGAKMRG